MEDLLDRRTRIGLVPEDRELAVPAAEKVLDLLGQVADRPRATSPSRAGPAPRARPRPRVVRTSWRRGCSASPGGRRPRTGRRRGRPRGRRMSGGGRRARRALHVAGDQAPGAGVGAEDLGQLGTHLRLGLGAASAGAGIEQAATRCCPWGRSGARCWRRRPRARSVRSRAHRVDERHLHRGRRHLGGEPPRRQATHRRDAQAEERRGVHRVGGHDGRARLDLPASVRMRPPRPRCATPTTSTPCSTGCSRLSASWLGSACMPRAGSAGIPISSAFMLSIANW